ncbi:MAG: cyanophycin synthetase, partial [Bacteroidales bacterium]
LHVLQHLQIPCDYMVGAQLDGFEVMVKLTQEAPYMLLEGDEYLTSPIDRRPKFHLYKPHIAVINGIAWDHINVFPTFPIYVEQFKIFADSLMPNASLFYYEGDSQAKQIGEQSRSDIKSSGYTYLPYSVKNGVTYIEYLGKQYPLQIFGQHNMQNLAAAWNVCQQIGIDEKQFLESIQSFKGASKRLELVASNEHAVVYKDFAHSPSKLEATIKAMKEQYPQRHLVAAMELHTFSSLREDFLEHYAHCMDLADTAIVYFNPAAVAHKNLALITKEMVVKAFKRSDLLVFDQSLALRSFLEQQIWNEQNLLWMSSGNFDGINEKELAYKLLDLH